MNNQNLGEKKHVVIVGGGFGGTYVARYLRPLICSDKIRVTIINRTNYFLFTPLLHEVATGGLTPESVVEPLLETFRHSNVTVLEEEVKKVEPSQKQVITSNQILNYDYLVLSSGAETNYYGTPGAKENTMTLKDLADAKNIRKHLIDLCEKIEAVKDNEAERTKLLSCIIVGAGPTGVELAAEAMEFMHQILKDYYHESFNKTHININLVAASPDVLPMFPIELRKIARDVLVRKGIKVMTNEQVMGVEPGKIIFADKSFLEGSTIIWVAGVKPINIELQGAEREKNGRVKIDEYLRVIGSPEVAGIYSLGDASGTAPMLAQVATQQGKTVAQNIIATLENKPLVKFKYFEKGMLVSLGQWYAAGKIFGMVMKGPLMWLLWRGVYLFNFHSTKKRLVIAGEWLVNFFYPRDITEC